MALIRLIPKIFYATLDEGLDFFVDGLAFSVLHRDVALAVVGRDGAVAYLVASHEDAAKDRPEIAIETDAIEVEHARLTSHRPALLHPNLNRVIRRPWGAFEFAVLDVTGVCVVFRQWRHTD